MGLLTIGAFAKASRLSPKALRLYDELGLLPPAHVDPVTGYRRYAPEQVERARLVAWLRRLGMPLVRIRHVCSLDEGHAAQEIRSFWARAEADFAARRDLVAFLVGHLEREDPAVTTTASPLSIRYAAGSDVGLVREANQDTAYAGSRLLAAVEALKYLETDGIPAGGLLDVLADAVEQAEQAVDGAARTGSAAEGTGTTLTAMLWTGSQLALVHIGDCRVYLLRDGELFRITHDHTVVQTMIDEGRITPEEAASHPQRSMLVRALGSGADATADLRLHDAGDGDRYLLCSDGLPTVVPDGEIQRVLTDAPEPERAVRELVALANGAGGPDNVSCVVADVVADA
ncbi:MerR family transcriptional regulator [Streptomyces sp. NPDC058762]|uniref:MerR family transcriptional regulator n=1 Tax=Streptomyces sp. NPDC058762 TaxID=3346629 RepID=UPI0036773806